MAVFQLECKEHEERQADFPTKQVSQSILEMTASFADGVIFTQISW